MGIPPDRVWNAGRGTAGDGYLRFPLLEHGRTVSFYQSHSEPMYGVGEDKGSNGVQAGVGTG